ncbi:hypothetical protein L2K20_01845 [Mycobacterium sp. MBM]|nr:hypothetical protein [Mycobacterium sp. MBM]
MNSFRLAGFGTLALGAVLTAAPAQATPPPTLCAPDAVCTVRLTSVTADVVDGTITGTPVGSTQAITLAGQADAYLMSDGFGDTPPDPIRTWDTTIDQVEGLDTSPADPNWYGNAKARVFLPRTLNDLATRFPPQSLLVRFRDDETHPGALTLVSIQPSLR